MALVFPFGHASGSLLDVKKCKTGSCASETAANELPQDGIYRVSGGTVMEDTGDWSIAGHSFKPAALRSIEYLSCKISKDLRRLRAIRGNARSEGGALIAHRIVRSNSRSMFFFWAILRSAGYRGFEHERSLVFGLADSIMPVPLTEILVGAVSSSSGSEWNFKASDGTEDSVMEVLVSS
jgi:hypothetical protein